MKAPLFMFPDTVTIKSFKGTSAYGKVFDLAVSSRARIERKRRLIKKSTGEKVMSEVTIFLPYTQKDLKAESEILIDGIGHTVQLANPIKGFRSISHVEAFLT
jgi:hypothetical protein